MLGLSEMLRRALWPGQARPGTGDGFPEAVGHLKALVPGKGECERLREDSRKGGNMI